MASYTVDLNSMQQAANTMATTMTTIQQKCQQALDAAESAQSSGWLDEAAEAFSKQLQQWTDDQNKMLKAMSDFSDALTTSQQSYSNVSKKNAAAF